MKYKLVVCGGTFDHFHGGHEAFLRAALSVSEHVLLGITSNRYVHIYKSQQAIQQYEKRRERVNAFLKKEKAIERVTIEPIDTILYPLKWEVLPIEAIIVTGDTKAGADKINQDRKTKGLHLLEILTVPLHADDTGKKISSTNIREGKVNTHGISYIKPEWFRNDLLLPEDERQGFKKPFGQLSTDISLLQSFDPNKLVTIGDIVTTDCNRQGIGQKLSVVDFTVQRKKTYQKIQELGFSGKEVVISAENPPGHITPSLFSAISRAVSFLSQYRQIIITVSGEEDLAVIPMVLAVPLDFTIVYGQPHEGFVYLRVTIQSKDKAYTFLQRFVSR